jgi:hypothetical protein
VVCGAYLLFLPAGVSVSHLTPIRLADGLKYVLDYKCSEEEIETSKDSYRPFP